MHVNALVINASTNTKIKPGLQLPLFIFVFRKDFRIWRTKVELILSNHEDVAQWTLLLPMPFLIICYSVRLHHSLELTLMHKLDQIPFQGVGFNSSATIEGLIIWMARSFCREYVRNKVNWRKDRRACTCTRFIALYSLFGGRRNHLPADFAQQLPAKKYNSACEEWSYFPL